MVPNTILTLLGWHLPPGILSRSVEECGGALIRGRKVPQRNPIRQYKGTESWVEVVGKRILNGSPWERDPGCSK